MIDKNAESQSIALGEVQLLLSEKRTSLSVMRTGIAVLVLPMSLIGFLIATSKYYNTQEVLHFMIPLVVVNIALIILGAYLIIHSLMKMRRYDMHIQQIKKKYSAIAEFIQ